MAEGRKGEREHRNGLKKERRYESKELGEVSGMDKEEGGAMEGRKKI